MNKDELIKAIEEYRKDPDMDRAILLDGEWGSGKTYFVRNYLENKPKYIYISAFGIKEGLDIDKIILASLPKDAFDNSQKKIRTGTKRIISTKTPDIIMYFLKQVSIKGYKIPDSFFSLFDASTIIKISAKILEEYLIIIDDIERSTIPLSDLLGKINTYTEQYELKVLLVANTNEIKNEQHDLFAKYEDKIIREKLSFQQDYQSILPDLINNIDGDEVKELLQKNKQSILDFIDSYNITNIRKIQSGIEKAAEVIKIIQTNFQYKNDEEYKKLIKDIILFFIYNETGSDKITIDQYEDIQSICLPPDKYDEPNSIRYFKFIATYGILEIRSNSERIRKTLERHIKTLIDSRQNKDDPAMTLYNNTYRIEDEEIIALEQNIIDKLESNNYTYKFYPRILLVLIRCKNIMGDNSFLDKARTYIFSHLDNIDDQDYDFIYLATFTYCSQEEQSEYQNEMDKLRNKIQISKEQKAFMSINSALKESDWSKKLNEAVFESQEEIIFQKQFFSILDTNTILKKLRSDNVKTSDFWNVRDAINIYQKFKDQPNLFPEAEHNALIKFYNSFKKLRPKTHTAKLVFEYIKKDLKSYIDSYQGNSHH